MTVIHVWMRSLKLSIWVEIFVGRGSKWLRRFWLKMDVFKHTLNTYFHAASGQIYSIFLKEQFFKVKPSPLHIVVVLRGVRDKLAFNENRA